MEGINNKRLMKAVSKLVGRAATAVRDDKEAEMNTYTVSTTSASTHSNAFGQAGTGSYTYYPSPTITAGGMGGLFPYPTTTTTDYVQPAPAITFTDEQMTSFMDKLANLLSKGWECLRCHRIWNPRETGCEFCNFIDRLEGKDVERDTA